MPTLIGVIAAALLLWVSAVGADEIAPETDKLLWCASAFYWLAGSADDAGEAEEAELYDSWYAALVEEGSAALAAAGTTAERVEEIIASYDDLVLGELATDKARYDVLGCPALLPAE